MFIKTCLHCGSNFDLKQKFKQRFSKSRADKSICCSRSCYKKLAFKNGQIKNFKKFTLSGRTKEANAKKGAKGECHPLWIKDRNSVKYKQTPELKNWKNIVLTRDDNTCVLCKSKSNLVVDHIKPYAFYPEIRYDPGNGRTLCDPCHKKTNTHGRNKIHVRIKNISEEIASEYNAGNGSYRSLGKKYCISIATIAKIIRKEGAYAIQKSSPEQIFSCKNERGRDES